MKSQMHRPILSAAIIFVALALAFAVLIAVAARIDGAFDQTVLLSAGSALLGAGLTFFLLRAFQIADGGDR